MNKAVEFELGVRVIMPNDPVKYEITRIYRVGENTFVNLTSPQGKLKSEIAIETIKLAYPRRVLMP